MSSSSLFQQLIAIKVVPFLDDLDDVVALSSVNRELRAAIWVDKEEYIWKNLCVSHMAASSYQEDEMDKARHVDPIIQPSDDGDIQLPSYSWRQMALSLNNVLKGRYYFLSMKDAADGDFQQEDDSDLECSFDGIGRRGHLCCFVLGEG